MSKLINGKDNTEGVVNLTLKDNQIYIYKESKDGVELEKHPYTPWVLSPRPYASHSERLSGNQHYKFITSVTSDQFADLADSWQKEIWMPRQVEESFTLAEGVTYFKGRKINEVSILSFDIETSGLAMDETSQTFIISNTFRRNGEITRKLFTLDEYDNQIEMIQDWCKWVNLVNPSIMCGHNILSYDLPYLNNITSLELGRDGSKAVFAEKTSKVRKDGSQQYDFHNVRITGREIVDTFFLSLKYDIARDFPAYGLKPIIRHLGLEKADRSFVDASKMSTYYKERGETWAKAKAYAMEDSEDSLKLFDIMAPSYFYLAQSIPKTFQQMINEASGSQLDALMIRSYLQDGQSQPKTSGKVPFEGAISMGVPGNYQHVKKADIASLYPSVMLEYNIHDPNKDPNNHMIQMLTYFRDERLRNKKLAKETGDRYYDDLQNAQKIMINSMYGFLGSGFLLYNFPQGAAAVTRKGRDILLKGVEWASGHTLQKVVKKITNKGKENEEFEYEWVVGEKVAEGQGYQIVNVDTDSFSVTNGKPSTSAEFAAELKILNSLYPNLIRWEDDGIYEKVIVVKAKNYVLVKNGKTKFKGSSLTDQKKEPALTEMLQRMIYCLLNNESRDIKFIYESYIREALNISDINRWAVKKTVTKSVLNSERLNERKVMDAIDETIKAGIIEGIQEGDKVWLYSAINGEVQQTAKGELQFYKDGRPKMEPNYILRDVRMHSAQDQDIEHYVSRVLDTAMILSNVIDETEIIDYGLKSNKAALQQFLSPN